MKHSFYFENLDQSLAKGRLDRRQMLGLMAVAGGGLLVGCSVNPVTGQREFSLMGASQEIAMDQEHAPGQLSSDYGVTRDANLQRYVTSVGNGIGSVSHRAEMPYSYNAVNANYVNAYAFPGGTIGLTRGILLSMDSEAELAALIGHEVAHVSARHTAQRMSKQTLTGIAVAGAGLILASRMDSQAASLALGIGGLAAGALLARYSRGDEREADTLGMDYMVDAGHSPQGMVDLMDMLRGLSSSEPTMIEQMFSSHPMSSERYEGVRARAESHYQSAANRSMQRQRYMDNTAELRRLKPAIEKQQQAESAIMAEKYQEGADLLAASLKLAPNDYTGLVLMAKSRMIQERFADAQPFLDRAIDVYPEEAQARHLRGIVDVKKGNAAAAMKQFEVCDKLLPGNPSTIFLKAAAQSMLG